MRQYPRQFMTLSAWAVAAVVLLTPLHALPSSGQQMAVTGVTGSGFVVSPDGYILTNEHVIHGAEEITVYVGTTSYKATVVTASEGSDLALLKIPVRGLTPVRLGNSLLVELLEPVVAMGYPLAGYGRDLTTSQGEITAIRTNVPSREGRDTLQHDAVITYGSSGGPLFNALGEVIGVNFAGVEGAGLQFAIPIADAIPLLRNIPGFNPRDMGTAAVTVPASQIVSAYRAAVVFIDCTVEIAWGEFLPDPRSVAGFPNEAEIAVSGSGSIVEWLVERRFQVAGGAALSGSSEGYANRVAVIAFPDAATAQRAAQILLTDYPSILIDPSVFCDEVAGIDTRELARNTAVAAGVAGAYWIKFLSYTCISCGGYFRWGSTPQCLSPTYHACGRIESSAVFVAGSLVLLVQLGWSNSHTLREWSGDVWLGDNTYCYDKGTVVRVRSKDSYPLPCVSLTGVLSGVQERLITGAAFASKLDGLIRLAATSLVNRIASAP